MHELAEQRLGRLPLVAAADLPRQQAVEGRAHDGELEIDVDLQRHGSGEGLHVEQVEGDGVLDENAAGVAFHQAGGSLVELVGDQQDGLFVANVGDGDLADGVGIALDGDPLVEDTGVAEGTDAVLAAGALGDVVLSGEGVVA